MEMKEAQKKVREYFEKGQFEVWPRFAILARLNEEISEIARIIFIEEGLRKKKESDNLNYVDEFGDALFQLIHLANQCNVDLDEALEHVFKKYEKYIEKKKQKNENKT